MPKRKREPRPIDEMTLDELEGVEWGPTDFPTYVVRNAHRLRLVPLKSFTLEDLRLMIGQQVGLQFLVPLALRRLELDPLGAGDCYPGDVLSAIARLPDDFWTKHPQWAPDAVRLIDRGIEQLRLENPSDRLIAELSDRRAAIASCA